jgi:hypothetical protein
LYEGEARRTVLNPQVAVGEYVAEDVELFDNSVRAVGEFLRLPASAANVRSAAVWCARVEANAARVRRRLEYVAEQEG